MSHHPERIRTVLSRYALDVQSTEQVDAQLWRVYTDRGNYLLQHERDSEAAKIRFEALEYVSKRGFRRVPRFVRTIFGDPWVDEQSFLFTLRDDCEGQLLAITPEDIIPAARNLAYLHIALEGFASTGHRLPSHYGHWNQRFHQCEKLIVERIALYKNASVQNTFTHTFSRYGSWLAERAGQMTIALERALFEEQVSEDQQASRVCFGDYRLKWLRKTNRGHVITLGFDNITSDTPLYDIGRFCHSLFEAGHPDAVIDAIQTYRDTRALTDRQLRIVCAYVFFPHVAWQIALLGWNAKEEQHDVIAAKLQAAVEKQQRLEAILVSDPLIKEVWG